MDFHCISHGNYGLNSSSNLKDTSWVSAGIICWYRVMKPDENQNIYKKGYIVSIDHDLKKVKLKPSESFGSQYLENKAMPNLIIETDLSLLLPAMHAYIPQGYEDMIKMSVVNEAEMLGNFISRFFKNMVYTFIDDILVYIHNKKFVDNLFSRNSQLFYGKIMKKNTIFTLRDFPAHLYSLVTNCFYKAQENKKNQVIFFYGVSGSGKTLNFNKALEFLSSLNNDRLEEIEYNMTKSVFFDAFEEKLNACNNLIGLFGNARTNIHDNSSRFMKYFQIIVNKKKKKIEGGLIDCFFLEKTRVTRIREENLFESNYKIFYLILENFPDNILRNIGLTNKKGEPKKISEFKILNTKNQKIELNQDESGYQNILKFFKLFNFKEDEILTIFKIISTILLVSETNFFENMAILSQIWEIEVNAITEFFQQISSKQIIDLCNEIYLQLFKLLIKRFNTVLLKEVRGTEISKLSEFKANFQNKMASNSHPKYLSINFFEILGFEVISENNAGIGMGFYQLINHYLNEKMQQYYLENIFKAEEVEFLQEGILSNTPHIKFRDNLYILDIFENKSWENLDNCTQQIQLKLSNNEKYPNIAKEFFDKLEKLMILDKNDLIFIQKKTESFVIFHSIREIVYNFADFCPSLQKIDSVYQKFEEDILICSKNPTFSHFLSKKPETNSPDFSFGVLSNQLTNILKSFSNYDKYYMKCLSPRNFSHNATTNFNCFYILDQLKLMNCENLILFKKEGFLIKKTYKQFYQDYINLANVTINLKLKEQSHDHRKVVEYIIEKVIPEFCEKKKVLFGKTRIFLNQEAANALENKLMALWKKQNEKAHLIQKNYHCFKFRSNLKMGMKGLKVLLKAIIKLQAKRKSNKQRQIFLKKKKAIAMIFDIERKHERRYYFNRFFRATTQIFLKKKNVRFIEKKLTEPWKENPQENLIDTPKYQKSCFKDKKPDKNDNNFREHSVDKERVKRKTIQKKNHFLRRISSKSSDYIKNSQMSPSIVRMMSENEGRITDSPRRRKCIAAKSFNDFENKSHNTILEEYLEISSKKQYSPKEIKDFPISNDLNFDFDSVDSELMKEILKNDSETFLMKYFSKKYSKIMCYQNKLLEAPLLDFPKKYHKTCKKCFKYILQYSGDRKTKFPINRQIEKLLKILLQWEHDQMRDEVFLQLIKQINKNPNVVSLQNLYKLLSIISSFIAPSEKFYFILLNYIVKKIAAEPENSTVLKYSFVRMMKTKEKGPRKNLPLANEVSCIEQLKMILIPIYFLSGEHFIINIESYTTVGEIIDEITKRFKLSDRRENLGLFLISKLRKNLEIFEDETFLSEEDNFLDYLASCEKMKKEMENYQITFTIIFKIAYFFDTTFQSNDDITLFYIQMVHEYLQGKFLLTEENVIFLASCKMAIDHGDFSAEKVRFLKINIEDYIPNNFIEVHKPQTWIDRILINYLQMKTYSKVLSKKRFLEFLKKFKTFASHQYTVVYSLEKIGLGLKQGVLEKRVEVSVQQNRLIIIKSNEILICQGKSLLDDAVSVSYDLIKNMYMKEDAENHLIIEETEKKHHMVNSKAKDIEKIVKFYLKKTN